MDNTPTPKPRWFRLTPDRLVLLLLAVEGLLWLSERLGWPGWHKGYAVLIAIASVGVFFLLMLLWFVVALIFRLRFQFSIRSLLLLTVAIAISCSWLSMEMRRAKKQYDLLVTTGAGVVYDFQIDQTGVSSQWLPGPKWLPRLLGYDFFGDVVGALFEEPDSDIKLQYAKEWPHLRRLEAWHLTNSGLKHFEGLDQLKHLFISGEFTDEGLQHLEGLTQLEDLELSRAWVTDEGVQRLQQALPNCKISAR